MSDEPVVLATICLRGGTAAAWTAANPVLKLCELGVETDTDKIKRGDGVSDWNTLAYSLGGYSELVAGMAALELIAGDMIFATGAATVDRIPTTAFMRAVLNAGSAAELAAAAGLETVLGRLTALEGAMSTAQSDIAALIDAVNNHEARITALEP